MTGISSFWLCMELYLNFNRSGGNMRILPMSQKVTVSMGLTAKPVAAAPECK